MPFIIAAGTFVTTTPDGLLGAGFQSVNLSWNPQIQRLYQLGSVVPFDKNVIKQKSMSIARYGGQSLSYNVIANTTCEDANHITININANNCSTGSIISITDDFYISGYSYSKDVQGWGTETFNLIAKPEVIGGGDGVEARMIRGVAEGETSTDGGASTGITFVVGGTTTDGQTMEVSAGSPGIGRVSNMIFGEVSAVGGGTGKADGRVGNASVSIPYTPIYIPL